MGRLEAPEEAGCGGHGGHDGRDLEWEIDPRMKEEGGESGEAAGEEEKRLTCVRVDAAAAPESGGERSGQEDGPCDGAGPAPFDDCLDGIAVEVFPEDLAGESGEALVMREEHVEGA